MNTTDREEQLVELVYSVLGYEHADNITKCRHVANKILAWHEQRVAEEKSALLLELRDDITHGYITVGQIVETIDWYIKSVEKAPPITDEDA